MRETTGKNDSIPVDDLSLSSDDISRAMKAMSVSEVNVLEKPIRLLWQRGAVAAGKYHPVWIRFNPYETKFLFIGL